MFNIFRRFRVKPLLIPDYDPYDPRPYPGDIKPGYYTPAEVKKLRKEHRGNADARRFIREMEEE